LTPNVPYGTIKIHFNQGENMNDEDYEIKQNLSLSISYYIHEKMIEYKDEYDGKLDVTDVLNGLCIYLAGIIVNRPDKSKIYELTEQVNFLIKQMVKEILEANKE